MRPTWPNSLANSGSPLLAGRPPSAPHDAFGYGDALGRPELRSAVADYLARARGVHAVEDRVVICSGFHHGLTLIARALRARRVRAVAVESYGLDVYRDVLTSPGLRTPVLAVDDHGAGPTCRTACAGSVRYC